ncbi:hypothetical protein ACFLR4_03700 [Bacteroidota bacterium]
MEGSLHFDINDIYPERDRVLNQIGVPADASINGKVEAALQRSLKLFETLAQPAGLMKGIQVCLKVKGKMQKMQFCTIFIQGRKIYLSLH